MSGRISDVVRAKRDVRPMQRAAKRILARISLAAGLAAAALSCILFFIAGTGSPAVFVSAACAVVLLAGTAGSWYLTREEVPRACRSLQDRLMQKIASDLVIRLDVTGNRAEVTGSNARDFGFLSGQFDDALEQLCARVYIGDRRRFARRLTEYIEGDGKEQYIDEFRMLDANGRTRTLLVRGKLEPDDKGREAWFVAIAEDVTGLRQGPAGAQPAANIDELTRLPNRRCFEDDLAFELDGGRRCGVLLAGLDGFKHINNVYGYDIGDMLLRSVAGRLSAVLGDLGLAYRYAGDVFAVVFTAPWDNEKRIKDIVGEVYRRACNVRGQEIYLSASLGSACSPRDGISAQEIIHAAELELFEAKQRGRNCHIMYRTRQSCRETADDDRKRDAPRDRERLRRVHTLLPAGDRPEEQGASPSGQAVAVGHGRHRPGGTGRIHTARGVRRADRSAGAVGARKGVRPVRAWHRSGHDGLYVSVNVSIMQMLSGDMVGTVRRALQETGLSPEFLVLEITENMFIQDMDTAVVPQLASLGNSAYASRWTTSAKAIRR